MFISIIFRATSIDETNKTQQKVRGSKFMFKISTVHAITCIQTTTPLRNRWWFRWQCPVLVLRSCIFLEPGVKVNGDYYRNTSVLLINQSIKTHFYSAICRNESEAHVATRTRLSVQIVRFFKIRLKVLNRSALRQLYVSEFQTEGALTLKAFADIVSAIRGTTSNSLSDDLLDIRCVFGDYYVFQQDCQDGAPAHWTCCRERETPEFIPPEMWPPNSPDLNLVDYSIWDMLQERVYRSRIHDVKELKERLLSEWRLLDRAHRHRGSDCAVA